MAEPHDRKPILTIEQQIEHLKQKTAYEILRCLVGSEMCIRDSCSIVRIGFLSWGSAMLGLLSLI